MKIWLKTYRYLKNILTHLETMEGFGHIDLLPRLDPLLISRDQNAPDELIELTEKEANNLNAKLAVFNSILTPTIPIKFTNLIYGPFTQASGGFGLSTGALLLLKITLLPVILCASTLVGAGIAIYVADRTFSEEEKAKDTLQADLFDSQIKLCCSQVMHNLSIKKYNEEFSHPHNLSRSLTIIPSSRKSNSLTPHIEMQTFSNDRHPPKISGGGFTPPSKQLSPRLSRSIGRAVGYFGSLMAFVYAGAAIKAAALIGAATLVTVLGPVGLGITLASVALFSIYMASKHHSELTRIMMAQNEVAKRYELALMYEKDSNLLNEETKSLRRTRQASHAEKDLGLPRVCPSVIPTVASVGSKIITSLKSCFRTQRTDKDSDTQVHADSLPSAQIY